MSRETVVNLCEYRRQNNLDAIDTINATAFIQLRDEALKQGLPIKTVLREHIFGLALVIKAVDGEQDAVQLLDTISQALSQ